MTDSANRYRLSGSRFIWKKVVLLLPFKGDYATLLELQAPHASPPPLFGKPFNDLSYASCVNHRWYVMVDSLCAEWALRLVESTHTLENPLDVFLLPDPDPEVTVLSSSADIDALLTKIDVLR